MSGYGVKRAEHRNGTNQPAPQPTRSGSWPPQRGVSRQVDRAQMLTP